MDFSQLTDDQLLQLIKGVMGEAVKRGTAIAKAAQDVYDDSAEELRVKAEVAARIAQEEAEKRKAEIRRKAESEARAEGLKHEQDALKETWAHKSAAIAAFVQEIKRTNPKWGEQLDQGFQMNLWANGPDVRLYIQEGSRRGWEVVVF